jgi:uncharacterized protein YjdB
MKKRIVYSLLSKLLVCFILLSMTGIGNLAYAAEDATNGSKSESDIIDIGDSYAAKEIKALVDAHIISGFGNGLFKPNEAMTRAQLAKVLVLSLGLKEDSSAAASFNDVPDDSWYKGFVGALIQSHITDGTSPSTFSPDKQVSREELAVFFIRAFDLEKKAKTVASGIQFSDADQISYWAKSYVDFASQIGFINGISNADATVRFEPKGNAERQALARLAYEFKFNSKIYLEKANQIGSLPTGDIPTPTPTPTPTPAPSSTNGSTGSGSSSDDSSGSGSNFVVGIKTIDPIIASVAVGGSYNLPYTVTAKMNDGTTMQTAVTWSPSTVDTSKSAVLTFTGSVNGYSGTVSLTLKVEAPIGTPVQVEEGKPLAFTGGITVNLGNTKLPTGLSLTLKEVSAADLPATSPGISVAGKVLEFSFSADINALITAPVMIELPLNPDADATKAGIFYLNTATGAWDYQPSVEQNKTVKAAVTHFSTYGVLVDTIAPSKPTVRAAAKSANSITLGLNATDYSGVKKYLIYRDGAFIAESSTATFTETSLASLKTYVYSVKAVDNLGNISEASDDVAVTTEVTFINSIALDQTTVILGKVGDSVTLKATVSPADATEAVKWISTNPFVASVDENGKVTAVATGSATISAVAATNPTVRKQAVITVMGESGFTVTPTNVAYTLAPSGSEEFDLGVAIKPDAKISKLDVVFAIDTTGSMSSSITSVQKNAIDIMNKIRGTVPDAQFGVVSFKDYAYYSGGDEPFYLNQKVTDDPSLVTNGVNKLTATGGADTPESYTRVLYELADMAERETFVNWRSDAKKLVVLFGDAATHDTDFAGFNFGPDPGRDGIANTADDLDFQNTVQKVRDAGIVVLAIQSGYDSQATPTFKGMSIGYSDAVGTRGDYKSLDNADEIPQIVNTFAGSQGKSFNNLNVTVTDAAYAYRDWISTDHPSGYNNVSVTGSTYTFKTKIQVPNGTKEGNYKFKVSAVADGLVLGQTDVSVDVLNVAVSGVTVTPSITLDAGVTGTLTAQITPTNAQNQKVTWTTSDPAVVDFASTPGNTLLTTVVGKSTGTATITVTTDDGHQTANSVVTITDTTAPATVTNLVYTYLNPTTARLSWTKASDNVGTVGYNVYQNGALIGTKFDTITAVTYDITGLTPGMLYTFGVSAFDQAGNTGSVTSATYHDGLAMTGFTVGSYATASTNPVQQDSNAAIVAVMQSGHVLAVQSRHVVSYELSINSFAAEQGYVEDNNPNPVDHTDWTMLS